MRINRTHEETTAYA